jgi:DNA repair exonuclease SbcCD ATPase subunit
LDGRRAGGVAEVVQGESKRIPPANEHCPGITSFSILLSSLIMEYQEYWNNFDLSRREFDVERFLRQEQGEERRRLEKDLERIEDLLEEREDIHSENVDELQSKLDWYVERLEQEYRSFGLDRETLDHLKSKIEQLYSELRREKRQQWRDKIELEKERREIERTIEEIEDEYSLWELIK